MSKDSLRSIVNLAGEFVGTTDPQVLTDKDINIQLNDLFQTTPAMGALLRDNGTIFVPLPRGAGFLALKVKDDGSDIEWGVLKPAGGGTGTTGVTGVMIGAGSGNVTGKANPTGAFLGDSDVQTISGAKEFQNTTLKLRDQSTSNALTLRNPFLNSGASAETALTIPYKYIIWREASTIHCMNCQTKRIESSGVTTSPEVVIQYALDNSLRAGIFICPGTYLVGFAGGFTGLNVSQDETTVVMDSGTLISVPGGYTGSLWKITNNNQCHFRGGRFAENTTIANLWTCFDINVAAGNRVVGCTFEDMYIRNALNGIRLKTDGTGWANINTFNKIFIDNSIIAILFEHTGTFTAAQSGCNTNGFHNMTLQRSSSAATHGIKDVNGRRNMFENVYVADYSGAQITMTISANAEHTQILGGTCTALNFADATPAGKETFIRDEYQGDFAKNRKSYSYEDHKVQSVPSDPASGYVRRYPKVIDANNDGLCVKRKINGAVVEVQL